MTRQEILDRIPGKKEESKALMVEILDHFEGKFCDIAENLTIDSLEDLSKIEVAYDIATSMGLDLY